MGLLKAGKEALKTTFADQWIEFVTLDNTTSSVLVQRAYPKENGSNTKRTEGVITNGTRIAVPEGMAMMIVDQGKVVEFTAEPGEFVYDTSTEPTVFYGGLGKGVKDSFKKFTDSFKFGGQPPKDQRVYYINLKEIQGFNFGTSEPINFADPKYGITVYIRFYGNYSIRVVDPLALVANVVSSIATDVVYVDIFTEEGQIREEFMTHLTSALSILAHEEDASFNDLPRYQSKLAKIMNEELDEEWIKTRGIEIVSVAIPSVSLTEKSQEDIRKYDEVNFASRNTAGFMTAATAQAMRDAANNEGGIAGTFMGMNVGNLIGQNVGNIATAAFAGENNTVASEDNADEWECPVCKKKVKGNFCQECGAKKPSKSFCPKCGTEIKEDTKFCPKCGEKFDKQQN